jgi:hypothetical protein
MNFFKKHAAPTLHNAVGTVLATLATFVLSFLIPSIRRILLSSVSIPVWVALTVTAVIVFSLLFYVAGLRRKLGAAHSQIAKSAMEEERRARAIGATIDKAHATLTAPKPWIHRWRT